MLLSTSRLTIQELDASMAYAIHLQSLEEDVRRYVPDEVFESEEESLTVIQSLQSNYETKRGPLVYVVTLKEGTLIGYVQLVPMQDGKWEVGYHIAKMYTQQGYAFEALRGFLPVIMPQLHLLAVEGITLQENLASQRVLEKCGFQRIAQCVDTYQGTKKEVIKYRYSL